MVAAKAFGITEFLNPNDCDEPIQQVFNQVILQSSEWHAYAVHICRDTKVDTQQPCNRQCNS